MDVFQPIPDIPATSGSTSIDETGGGFGQHFPINGSRPYSPNIFRNRGSEDTNQAPILLGVGGALVLVSIFLLIARIWSRARPVGRLKLDDWTIVGATCLAIIQYLILAASVLNGLGRHTRFVPFPQRLAALRLLFISQVFWYWSITLVKLSVALLLLRLKHTRPWRIFLYSLIVLSLLAVIVQTCFQFLQCQPFSVYWDPRVFRTTPGGVRCFRRAIINANIITFSSIQVGLDLVFSFIPIIFIRKLNRPRREKIFMCVLMGLGLFASCAAIVRTLSLQSFYTNSDSFRSNVGVVLCAVLEVQFALIAATIPTLKAFMERSLVRFGLRVYDENTEEQVRGELVKLGFLGHGEVLVKDESVVVDRRPSAASTKSDVFGTPESAKRAKDQWGDSIADVGKEKEVAFQDMLANPAKEKEFV